MNTQQYFAAIDAIDLNPIKKKLMHGPSGEGWTPARADAVEREYRRFLYLMKAFPGEPTAPLADVDTFWHYHILDTMKYMADCDAVFGHYLHHYPYAGLEGEEDDEQVHAAAGARMAQLYDAAFGKGEFAHAVQVLDASAAWCIVPPSASQPAAASGQRAQTDTVASAWCIVPPSAPRASDRQAANAFGLAATAAAWCIVPPSARASGIAATTPSVRLKPASAWCIVPPSAPPVRRAAPARS